MAELALGRWAGGVLDRALADGESMTVLVGNHSVTVTGPPDPGQEPGGGGQGTLTKIGTITIESNRPIVDGQVVATGPAGVFFTIKAEGFVSTDPNWAAWKDLNYRWSFDDPGWYTRHDTDDLPWGRYYNVDSVETLVEDGKVPTGTSVTFLGNDRNIAFGPWVCHVFAPPAEDFGGNPHKVFTVRCEVRAEPSAEPLLVVEREVKIANPDTVFAGNRTALVCAAGDREDPDDPLWEKDKYPGALLCNTHLQALQGLGSGPMEGNSVVAPVRVLFRRGETPALAATSSQYWPPRSNRFQKLFIGSYGNPEDSPPLTSGQWDTRFGDLAVLADTEFAIYGIDHHGPYDPSDPFAVERPVDGLTIRAGKYKTVHDLSFRGWNVCLNGEVVDHPRYGWGLTNLVIGNTFIGDWSNFGIFAHGADPRKDTNTGPCYHGQCGVWIKQNMGAVVGAGRDEVGPPLFPDHGPFRCNAPGSPSAFNLVDYRSNSGWSGDTGDIQPNNRWGGWPIVANSPGFEGALHINWDRARAEGGQLIAEGASDQSEGIPETHPALPIKVLYDKVYTIVYIKSSPAAGLSISGPVVRNSVLVLPKQPTMLNNIEYMVRIRDNTPIPGQNEGTGVHPIYFHESVLDYGLEMYSNTLVDLRDYVAYSAPLIMPASEIWKYYLNENNVEHAPNRPDISVTAGPLDDTKLWDTNFPGLRAAPPTEYIQQHRITSNTSVAPIEVTDLNRTVSYKLGIGGNLKVILEKRAGTSGSFSEVSVFTESATGSLVDEGTGTWQYRFRIDELVTGSAWVQLWAFPAEPFPLQTTYAVPVGTAARYAPESGSPAYQTASGKIPVDDFFGRIRTGTPSRGAVEPDPVE